MNRLLNQIIKPLGGRLATIALIVLIPTQAVLASDDVWGYWVVPGKDAVVQLAQRDNNATMKLVRTLDPGLLDLNNPDKSLQSRPLTGSTIGTGFIQRGERWSGGKIYDPSSGKYYRANFRQIDSNHLIVRGYVAVPALGRDQTWTRLSSFKQQMLTFLTDVKSTADASSQNASALTVSTEMKLRGNAP